MVADIRVRTSRVSHGRAAVRVVACGMPLRCLTQGSFRFNRVLARAHSSRMQSKSLVQFGSLVLALASAGCDSDGRKAALPWSGQRTQVVDAKGEITEVAPSAECVQVEDACYEPEEKCGKEAADIVLGSDGQLLDYVCYPGEETLSVEEVESRDGNIAQNQNDAVILLDALDDGADIEGNVAIDANNVVLYGEDPKAAVVSGDLELDGNNILVRGVTIEGDADVKANNVTLALCVIEGDVVLSGNNTQLLGCEVWGNVTVSGMNAKLLGNRVVGTLTVSGMNAECEDNRKFVDADQDGVVDDGELSDALACE